MTLLSVIGDGIWILALSIMASTSLSAFRRLAPGTRIPVSFRADGRPGLRLSRAPALILIPAVAFVVSLVLVAFNRNVAASGDQILILFGVRCLVAGLFALVHLRWLKAALEVLTAEGALADPQ